MSGRDVSARIGLRLSFQPRDTHRVAIRLSAAGLFMGGLLAVLGLPRLDLHGPLHHVGIMDPLCGGTRATYLLAHGDWGGAWTYNPVVIPLAVLAVVALCRTAIGVLSGRWLTVRVVSWRPVVVLLMVAVIALAVRQQMYADLLTSDWTGTAAGR